MILSSRLCEFRLGHEFEHIPVLVQYIRNQAVDNSLCVSDFIERPHRDNPTANLINQKPLTPYIRLSTFPSVKSISLMGIPSFQQLLTGDALFLYATPTQIYTKGFRLSRGRGAVKI
jgi:hypothetical protein